MFSPQWALARQEARSAIHAYRNAERVMNGYDGASRSHRAGDWTAVTGDKSVNAENQGAIQTLRIRAREMVRNNHWAAKAAHVIPNNTVGTGIRPSFDENDELEKAFKAWARSTDCDADGLNNLYGLQSLAMRTTPESGEVLIVRERGEYRRGRIPTKLRLLEGDYLDESLTEPATSDRGPIIQGVEFDKRGRRVAYHLFKQHPGSVASYKTLERQRIPARNVVHHFDVWRPGQVRGVSWYAPILMKLGDWADYEQAQLVRQKVAACFTAFVRGGDDVVLPGDGETSGGRRLGKVQPGMIYRLGPGESVDFGRPPDVEGVGDYARIQGRAVAAGLGITYEALSGDLEGVNFSAGRMGWLEFQRQIEAWRHNMLIPRMLDPIARWVIEDAMIMGLADGTEEAKWTPPRREMIDPVKETAAAKERVRSGFSSLPEELEALGRDPEETLRRIAKNQELLDELGLILDSDPRRQNMNGTPRTAPEGEPNGA